MAPRAAHHGPLGQPRGVVDAAGLGQRALARAAPLEPALVQVLAVRPAGPRPLQPLPVVVAAVGVRGGGAALALGAALRLPVLEVGRGGLVGVGGSQADDVARLAGGLGLVLVLLLLLLLLLVLVLLLLRLRLGLDVGLGVLARVGGEGAPGAGRLGREGGLGDEAGGFLRGRGVFPSGDLLWERPMLAVWPLRLRFRTGALCV